MLHSPFGVCLLVHEQVHQKVSPIGQNTSRYVSATEADVLRCLAHSAISPACASGGFKGRRCMVSCVPIEHCTNCQSYIMRAFPALAIGKRRICFSRFHLSSRRSISRIVLTAFTILVSSYTRSDPCFALRSSSSPLRRLTLVLPPSTVILKFYSLPPIFLKPKLRNV